jgi:transposase
MVSAITAPATTLRVRVCSHHHEVKLVQPSLDSIMFEAMPEMLIDDRAYDSDDLDKDLRGRGIKRVSPHRRNRKKPETQDRRQPPRYKRRWIMERFLARIKHKRRLLNRREFHPENFLGCVQISAVIMRLKPFRDGFQQCHGTSSPSLYLALPEYQDSHIHQ